MRTVKVQTREPDLIRRIVLAALIGNDLKGGVRFSQRCIETVDLDAKNNTDECLRDKAIDRIVELAREHGVRLVLE